MFPDNGKTPSLKVQVQKLLLMPSSRQNNGYTGQRQKEEYNKDLLQPPASVNKCRNRTTYS